MWQHFLAETQQIPERLLSFAIHLMTHTLNYNLKPSFFFQLEMRFAISKNFFQFTACIAFSMKYSQETKDM
jgi:hypothetical protein